VRPYAPGDRRWAEALLEEDMGTTRAVRLGEVLEPAALPGLVAERDGERIGLLTYLVDGDQFEVLSLHSRVENAGAGSALLQAAATLAAGRGCRRLWLVTTNDNLHALGFYQRRGLRLCALHAGALERDRALKPELPEVNPGNGIPMRDLLELELPLQVAGRAVVVGNASSVQRPEREAAWAATTPRPTTSSTTS
jgi:GNAT superfamily N-acetyltransferase